MRASFIVLFVLLFTSINSTGQDNKIVKFIKEHPDKSAVYLKHNGKTEVDINSDRVMPLASSVKIIVAIEYAHQVADGTISSSSMVDTAALHKYYIPNTDGGAQPAWISLMKKQDKFKDSKVSLEEVAKGMINFSSNANTEYLLDLLTLEKVNKRVDALGLKKHDEIYYFIAALGVINNRTKEELEKMSMEEYINKCVEVHNKLSNDPDYKNTITNLPFDVQKVWSNRLAGCTTKEYASVTEKINSHNYFDAEVQKHIDIVMGGIMQQPWAQKKLKYGGFKGGSTAFVLTQNIYFTTLEGETLEVSYFFNNLTPIQNMILQKGMSEFEVGLLFNKEGARDEIIRALNTN